ncbi:hypothetical protein IGI04_024882 [Brassica rapa subsp. trilocularis]|uniref:Zinc knuckle CX2CX4HX4C domain-containing protein n=1 Tax=Brassica rapa subsp. trilocularis TaxID=1813537 RepID=A0ABQ7MBG5_BRACM|nr:hypothetical protein IGI04_024882 [Brassica rapa subsp. trilocularis]
MFVVVFHCRNWLGFWRLEGDFEIFPTHYKKDESYRSIGLALGEVDKVDVDNGRVRVKINADEPLQFERKAGYSNGDVITVSLKYEELHRYCYTCKRISHEEGTCPELSTNQREVNRIARLEQKEKEELAAKEAFSAPARGFESQVRFDSQMRNPHNLDRARKLADQQVRRNERNGTEYNKKTEYEDLRARISSRRDYQAKTVWNRLEGNSVGKIPRDRERYHPYQKELPPDTRAFKRTYESHKHGRYGDSTSSSSWRVKGSSPQNRYRDQEESPERRRNDAPLRTYRSPDSQRTISEPYNAHRKRRIEGHNRRTAEREPEQERERETEEARRWRLKGKAIRENSGEKEDNQRQDRIANGTLIINEPTTLDIPENQVHVEMNKMITGPQRDDRAAHTSSGTATSNPVEGRETHTSGREMNKMGQAGHPSPPKETWLLSEEEINQITEQYASVDFEMDEEMLNEDDLLDETDDDLVVPETQEVVVKDNPAQKNTDDSGARGMGKETEKVKKIQKDSVPPISINKRRGTRSPDRKGTAASKKLAVRGRASPKGKLVKHGRPNSSRAPGMIPVHHLIDFDRKVWNVDLVHEFIAVADVPKVLDIRLSKTGRRDTYKLRKLYCPRRTQCKQTKSKGRYTNGDVRWMHPGKNMKKEQVSALSY